MEDALSALDQVLASASPLDTDLLATIVRVACICIDERSPTENLAQGLKWVRVALSLEPRDPHALLLEARALDRLDQRFATASPQRLGLAIARLKEVIRSGVEPYCAEARALLHQATASELLPSDSLRARHLRRLKEFVANEQAAVQRKGDSPIKEMKGMTLKGLGLKGEDGEVSVLEALAKLRAGEGIPLTKPKAKKLEAFLRLVDDRPEPPSRAFLDEYAASRRSLGCLSLVSWNAKMLNVTDQRDEDWLAAAAEKARNIGARASAPDVQADVVCIQEAPGPQLAARGGAGAREAVSKAVLPNTLRACMQECAGAAAGPARQYHCVCVDVHCLVRDPMHPAGVDEGEQHVFCYDAHALWLVRPPYELLGTF